MCLLAADFAILDYFRNQLPNMLMLRIFEQGENKADHLLCGDVVKLLMNLQNSLRSPELRFDFILALAPAHTVGCGAVM